MGKHCKLFLFKKSACIAYNQQKMRSFHVVTSQKVCCEESCLCSLVVDIVSFT